MRLRDKFDRMLDLMKQYPINPREEKEKADLEQDFFILCRRFDQTGLYPGKYAEPQLTKLLNLQAEYEKLYHDFVDLWEEVQTGKTVLPEVKA